MKTCPKCKRPCNMGNSPNEQECTETDDDEGVCAAYAKLEELRDAVRNVRDVKGRYHTQKAFESLVALLPESTAAVCPATVVCPNCNNLRYIQDAGFACCETCNPNNSFYEKPIQTP